MFKSVKVGGRGSASVRLFGVFKGAQLDANSKKREGGDLAAEITKRPEVTGALGQVAEAFGPAKGKSGLQRVLLVGLGDKASFDVGKLRNVAASIGRRLASIGSTTLSVELDAALSGAKSDLTLAGRCFGEGLGLLSYDNDILRGKATDVPTRHALILQSASKAFASGMQLGLDLAECTNYARTLSQLPPNRCTPEFLAGEARKLARQTGMKCTVVSGAQLLKEGCVGIHNVGKASDHKPCLSRLEYSPTGARRAKPAVLVGKTMTYDSGGLSIKVGGGMRGMKRDMDGGAAVFGAMKAIATVLKPRRRVVALLCSAENAISDEAYRPDDVLDFANGVTVEVTNTDAEGRLVLADGLIWACQREDPEFIVDIATLTGGVVIALGSVYAGMWCDDDKLRAKIEAASNVTGERLWRLPHHDEYRDMMRSPCADIVNSAPVREAHPIQGAAFLSYFVEQGIPWCHLDIAGVHACEKDDGPYVKGTATGFGTRLMAELVDR